MATTAQPQQAEPQKKKAYVRPQVRSERLLVPDLFTPSCVINEETGTC